MRRSDLTIEMKIAALCAVVCVVGCLLGWHAFIRSDLATIEVLKKKMALEQKKHQMSQTIQTHVAAIKSYDPFLSPSEEVSWAIEDITGIALDSGLSITSMSPADPQKGVYLNKLLLKVEADCGYHEMGRFVSRLESHSKFLKMNQLSLKRGKQGSKLKASMLIEMLARA
jgi:Tfp pilus assembly protein PilO